MEDKARVPVAIKPLEWEYVERKTMTYTAFWADGDVAYYIDQSFGSDSYYFRTIRWPEETIYDGDDLPSAKAAAQSDYEARIRSALSVPLPGIEGGDKGDGWQTMDTAPKDRTVVLLWNKVWLHPVMGYWSKTINAWLEYGSRDAKANIATHWRPLPAAPSASIEGETP